MSVFGLPLIKELLKDAGIPKERLKPIQDLIDKSLKLGLDRTALDTIISRIPIFGIPLRFVLKPILNKLFGQIKGKRQKEIKGEFEKEIEAEGPGLRPNIRG